MMRLPMDIRQIAPASLSFSCIRSVQLGDGQSNTSYILHPIGVPLATLMVMSHCARAFAKRVPRHSPFAGALLPFIIVVFIFVYDSAFFFQHCSRAAYSDSLSPCLWIRRTFLREIKDPATSTTLGAFVVPLRSPLLFSASRNSGLSRVRVLLRFTLCSLPRRARRSRLTSASVAREHRRSRTVSAARQATFGYPSASLGLRQNRASFLEEREKCAPELFVNVKRADPR